MKFKALHYRTFHPPAGPFELFSGLSTGEPGEVLLESARTGPATGRYSILLRRPFMEFRAKGARGKPLEALARLLERFRLPERESPLPFCGGAAGYFGYEVKNLIEPRLPQRARDDQGLPDILLYFYDRGIVFDHATNKAAVFAMADSMSSARLACEALRREVERPVLVTVPLGTGYGMDHANVAANMTRAGFISRVKRAKEFIRRGDIYQANLSQRFRFPFREDPLSVYARLREVNPSPFFGVFEAGDFRILSGSPERLLCLKDGELETRPIAGTRPRSKEKELLLSEKERAEHLMLVDLERNDLGRVCEYGSVVVDELFSLERYSHVTHIVSNVRGTPREGVTGLEALKAFFPGGTITGTPKIRSMEVIDLLEPTARGPYTGSLGYFSFDGKMDWNILIRSLVVRDGAATLQVGAGIVADSDPEKEYDETLHKAQAVLEAALGVAGPARAFDRFSRLALGL